MLPALVETHKAACEMDKPILDGLKKAGFKVGGEGGPGMTMKFFKNGGVCVPFGISNVTFPASCELTINLCIVGLLYRCRSSISYRGWQNKDQARPIG